MLWKIRHLVNLIFPKKKGTTMKIEVVPGILVYEVDGLIAGQTVTVTAQIGSLVSPAASYTVPETNEAPAAPTLTE